MSRKDSTRLARRLRQLGLEVRRTRRCHWQARDPRTGRCVTWSGTPSDRRWIRHVLADLRRIGVHL